MKSKENILEIYNKKANNNANNFQYIRIKKATLIPLKKNNNKNNLSIKKENNKEKTLKEKIKLNDLDYEFLESIKIKNKKTYFHHQISNSENKLKTYKEMSKSNVNLIVPKIKIKTDTKSDNIEQNSFRTEDSKPNNDICYIY